MRLNFITQKNSQRGEAEMGFFIVIVVVCAVVSGSLMILEWVKDTKNAKVMARKYGKPGTEIAADSHHYPGEYVAYCKKPILTAFTGTRMPCKIEDWSYPEKRLEELD